MCIRDSFYLDRNIEYKKGEEIKSWSLDGVMVEPSSKRKPSNNEIKKNPRSKSAVLRFMVKI